MAKPRKERELTLEEALPLAVAELTPLWIGSPPLLAASFNQKTKITELFPLEEKSRKTTFLIFFLDLTDSDNVHFFHYLKIWEKKFESHPLTLLIVIRNKFKGLVDQTLLPHFKKIQGLSSILVYDDHSRYSQALKIEKFPAVSVLDEGNVIFLSEGIKCVNETESFLQQFLRKKDPGLPFAAPYHSDTPLPETVLNLDFKSFDLKRQIENFKIDFTGKWEIRQDHLVTEEAGAQFEFECPSNSFAFVGRKMLPSFFSSSALHQSSAPAQIIVDINKATMPLNSRGADIESTLDGNTFVKVNQGKLYEVFRGLHLNEKRIRLRFPEANRMSVVFYGFRFFQAQSKIPRNDGT